MTTVGTERKTMYVRLCMSKSLVIKAKLEVSR